jgi:squamous cell carcinoma antigen recognized by T-cells 3
MSQRLSSAIADEMRAGDDTKPAPAIKKKEERRACYECGIAGHLLSE